jgi:hypothetical protein
MYKEIIQLIINGKPYLPNPGISTEAVKQRYYIDTLGPLNVPTCSWLSSTKDVIDGSGNVIEAVSAKAAHNYSVTAVKINGVIDPANGCDIVYTRTGSVLNGGTDQIASFNLLLFPKYRKLVEIDGDMVRVSY